MNGTPIPGLGSYQSVLKLINNHERRGRSELLFSHDIAGTKLVKQKDCMAVFGVCHFIGFE